MIDVAVAGVGASSFSAWGVDLEEVVVFVAIFGDNAVVGVLLSDMVGEGF